jgi:hypothetical protein
MAHHHGLVRVERELEAVGTVVGRWLRRDPAFRPDAFLGALGRVAALLAAARRVEGADEEVRRAVLGEARRSYEPVGGPLDVVALGASAWRTDSGFLGVTVALDASGTVLQVSATRPERALDAPQALWHMPLSAATGLAPADLAQGAWRLHGARVSADGRLSLAAGVTVQRVALPPDPWARFRVARFEELAARLMEAPLDPVSPPPTCWALLAGVDLSPPRIDEVRNAQRSVLRDGAGAEVHLAVPIRGDTAILRDNLVAMAAGRRPESWFGRVDVGGDGLRFDPWTALFDPPVRTRSGPTNALHLGLDRIAGRPATGRA